MKPAIFPFLILHFLMYLPLSAQTPVHLHHTGKEVEIRVGEQMVTRLIFPDSLKKPVLYPVKTTSGIELTRGFPMEPRTGDRVDHPHHVGIWFNHGDVNGLDFWNNSDAIPEDKRNQYGTIVLRDIISMKEKKGQAVIRTRSEWLAPDDKVLLEENTTYTFSAGKDFWIVDRKTRLTAKADSVTFTDSKEGMYGIRLRQEMELSNTKPARRIGSNGRVTDQPVTQNLTTSGSYLTSENLTDQDAWGKTARWIRLSGNVEGKTTSVIIMDHPSNLHFPAYWHARDYGLFAVNNMGSHSYDKKAARIEYQLIKKQSLTFNHRLIVQEGFPPRPAEIEDWYKLFIQP
ncbi:MAG: PmoA family protein [Bacteroidia bacterium]